MSMYLIRKLTNLSLPDIGNEFAKDHTTVMHAIKKVEASLKGGRKLVALLEAVDEESITLKYSAKESVEGKKKKEIVEHVDRFSMDQVNAVRPFIEFK